MEPSAVTGASVSAWPDPGRLRRLSQLSPRLRLPESWLKRAGLALWPEAGGWLHTTLANNSHSLTQFTATFISSDQNRVRDVVTKG